MRDTIKETNELRRGAGEFSTPIHATKGQARWDRKR